MASEPTLDASSFCISYPDSPNDATTTATDAQLRFARDFTHRLTRDGYAIVRNHGIDASDIERVFHAHKIFFDQPLEKRLRLRYLGHGKPARGFTPTHSEKTFRHRPDLSNAAPDAAETREQYTLGPPEDMEHPTPWFSDDDHSLATTFSMLRSFYTSLRHLGLKLMQALELGLSLPPGRLTSHFLPDAAEMLLNWYPPASRKALLSPHLKRIWPHSDLSIITLLFQDSVGGLEFEDREHPGEFRPVKPAGALGEEILVNVSDTLERWTNGVVAAGVHRVNVPAALIQGEEPNVHRNGVAEAAEEDDVVPERRSVVMLYRADGKTSAGPLSDFVTEERPARFEDMTAAEYLALKNRLTFGDGLPGADTQKEAPSLVLDSALEATA